MKHVGALLILPYGILMYATRSSDDNGTVIIFLIVWLINIVWIVIHAALYLKSNSDNLKLLRIIITLKFIIFLSLSIFNQFDGFGTNKIIDYLYFSTTCLVALGNFIVDRFIDRKYEIDFSSAPPKSAFNWRKTKIWKVCSISIFIFVSINLIFDIRTIFQLLGLAIIVIELAILYRAIYKAKIKSAE